MAQSDKPYFFVSYSHRDRETVRHVTRKLTENGISLWLDTQNLTPGMSWEQEITKALQNAVGVIVFLSSSSAESRWVLEEVKLAIDRGGIIVPILLEAPVHFEMPVGLWERQILDMSDEVVREQRIGLLIQALKTTLEEHDENSRGSGLRPRDVAEFAQKTRQQIQRATDHESSIPPKSVFIVHGHDIGLRDEVEGYLLGQGVETVVLSKMDNSHDSLFRKFLAWSEETRFAVVLLTADDVGAGRYQYDELDVGERSLQFRARQNVVLELGFFYGFLGWENVFILFKKPDRVFPNFERPSDLDGILFEEVDDTHAWKEYLRQRLLEAGFQIKQ